MPGVEAKEISLRVNGGFLAALDFGGTGHPVLLVHGSGHNAAAWTDVAFYLTDHCRVVAVDLRGHGQTRIDSSNAEQYWHDLASATQSLGWEKPVLVGHSLGGYAVTAVTASGRIRPRAVCVVDGLVLDDREVAVAEQRKWTTPEAMDQVRAQFRYGWSASPDQVREFIEQSVREAPDDWLNQGSRPELLRKVLERSFSHHEHSWLRRPTPAQIAVISAPSPDAFVYPSVEVYEHLTCPVTIVLPVQGFYTARKAEVRAVVEAHHERELVEMDTHHNVPMTRPAELARVILGLIPPNRLATGE
ncbi:alpha/beta fold hydrolase [Nocardiopsis alba]|uniref:alpha/beta fold hydrolase n=1 Tax=Nocardiopsis alba TaxID=53437 RepID=UPI0036510170